MPLPTDTSPATGSHARRRRHIGKRDGPEAKKTAFASRWGAGMLESLRGIRGHPAGGSQWEKASWTSRGEQPIAAVSGSAAVT